ncbi:N-acetylglucosamine-6-phosphate deacetylase [Alteromonadales bacterium alter-6D02]|nr:N-acetylglucosamine-6-phosphate deacetylase [Alteromonadales bacterium alter-6D02]
MQSNHYALKAATIVGEDNNYTDHYLVIKAGVINAITASLDPAIPCIDLGETTLVPGLIDLHIHGRQGCDVMDATMTSMTTISNSLASHGVTGFLATTVTSSWQETLDAMNNIGQASQQTMSGAQVLGGYSEGLFFTNEHKGAHNEQYFLELTHQRIDDLINASNHHLKVLALAPEIANACEMIEYLNEKKIKVMLGHTDATYDETLDAINAGACGGVHVFNGMRGIHHREPGCTGAVLVHNTNVEVIADGIHLHPAILKMICQLKKQQQITLISDCSNAGGLGDGHYQLGKTAIEVKDGVARTQSGSLAGSTLTLEKAVFNLSNMAEIELRDAIHMASLSPAQFLGIDKTVGSIALGKQADLAILDPHGKVQATIIQGRCIYNAAQESLSDHLNNIA